MTPLELFKIISKAYPKHIVNSICCVEATCKKNGYCQDMQSYNVLDFDAIKNEYYRGQQITMPASVDAVSIGKMQNYICFVEMKGWTNYIAHMSQQKKTVEETAKGYNLDGKLFDSQELCRKITSDPDLFAHIPTIFLLVTDIDVKSKGIESFADNMLTLAESSTDIYSKCVSVTRKTLDSVIHIERDFVYCKDFDNYVANL